MAKSIDFPPQIRDFGKLISSFSGRYYDYDVFTDFIDFTIACLLFDGDKPTADRLQEKYGKEYPKFSDLFFSLAQTTHANLQHDLDWYDVLGTTYEVIAANSKRSGLGQFFTPKSVCDFMAQIIYNEQDAKGLRVNDPACGSGRTLLAFNSVAPGNKLFADDLDPICTKMAAINLSMHGCIGQACNTNSLSPYDWRFGYAVNPHLMWMGIPNLISITKEQSHTYRHWEAVKNRHAEVPQPEPMPEPEPTPPNPFQQLTMF